MNKISLLLILFSVTTILAKAEGTLQLRPTLASGGSLHISNSATFTKFGQYGAAAAQQIKIRIGQAGEKIFFGFNNHLEGGTAFVPNIPYRIVAPSGQLAFSGTMPGPGQPGHIDTWAQAAAGPAQLGNGTGYNAINIPTLETGDYVLEFDISALGSDQLQIDLLDITVAGADLKARPGRLHCQGWQISTEKASNPFYGKVYPYNVKGVVYEVDFNQMQPYTFVIFFNSKGTANTGNTNLDRQSKPKFSTYPEYEVFLNPPDPLFYPSTKKQISFNSESKQNDCTSKDFCLNFSTNEEGILDGYIDIDGNGVEDGTDVRFLEVFDAAGTKCVSWNGKDKNGAEADLSNIKIYSSFGYGVTHLPLFDVEDNANGFKVRIVSPVVSPVKLFWDDTQITAGTATDGKINLDGCSDASGCHKWRNRGNNSNPESINTWWYTTLLYDTLAFNTPDNPPVHLSLDATKLVHQDTVLCSGDALSIFIHNDGSHYDPVKFTYTWLMDGQAQVAGGRELSKKFTANSTIVLRSSLKSNVACVSADTIRVRTVPKVKISAKILPGGCLLPKGSIEVSLLAGPAGTTFNWKQYSTNKTGNLQQLSDGTYNLLVQDPAFPGNCAVDTSFTIKNGNTDSIPTDFTFNDTGNAVVFWEGDEVQFTNLTKDVASFSWSFGDGGTSKQKNPTHRYDNAGKYAVTLSVIGANGCPGKIIKTIVISKRIPCIAELPNTFTPNNDKFNDDIGLLGEVISMDLIIFNRWGEAIFRSSEKSDRWNGIYRGTESPIGVYPYILEYDCPDDSGKLVQRKKVGEITLLR